MFQITPGAAGLFKEGTKHLSGLEESCLKNIEACQALSQITRTSLGPNVLPGMSKMLINQHDKLSVTSDAATIIKELDVVHPAAKMLVLASQMQEAEFGDGTNFVVVFGGELLSLAGALISQGLHPADIVAGYQKASQKALELLDSPEFTAYTLDDVRDQKKVERCLRAALASKQYGYEDKLASLIATACIQVYPPGATQFVTDNVRTCKILGGGVLDTTLVKGFVLNHDTEGTVKQLRNAKVAVFLSGIEVVKPETKATVLIQNAEQLRNYTKEEERQMEELVQQIAASGATCVVSGNAISELAIHFLERHHLMAVKVTSKFQLRRLCKATGATALVRLGAPTADELGLCEEVRVEEVGSTRVTVFRRTPDSPSAVATLVVRAATHNTLDDIERAIDDGVNTYKTLTRDGRVCAGAGATELELARRLAAWADTQPGVEQHAIRRFADAFEVVPRTLAENAGVNVIEQLAALYAAHNTNPRAALDLESGQVRDAVTQLNVLDSVAVKYWALKYAADAVNTVLRVDQIIMAKPAGGPKPKPPHAADAEDEGAGFD